MNNSQNTQKKRHKEILALVKEQEIENQEVLITELRKRGIVVTQATVSRDITRLGLGKAVSDNGVYCYVVPEQLKNIKFTGVFAQAVKKVEAAMNTVVIKTYSGMASAVCAALDLNDVPLIVGTIAGDDTIFAVKRSEKDALELIAKLRKLL
jgi:transcriptional regulator of arginine metabolism